MNSDKLNDWIQIVGMFAIVLSLLFVGYQLKQSQDIAIAAQNQERHSIAIEYYVWQGQNDDMVNLVGARHRVHLSASGGSGDDRSDRFIGLAYIKARMRLSIYDNNHFQYQSGFMTMESWRPYLHLTKRVCARGTDEGKIMLVHGEQFREGFRELCMSFIDAAE